MSTWTTSSEFQNFLLFQRHENGKLIKEKDEIIEDIHMDTIAPASSEAVQLPDTINMDDTLVSLYFPNLKHSASASWIEPKWDLDLDHLEKEEERDGSELVMSAGITAAIGIPRPPKHQNVDDEVEAFYSLIQQNSNNPQQQQHNSLIDALDKYSNRYPLTSTRDLLAKVIMKLWVNVSDPIFLSKFLMAFVFFFS
jgi:hypothetical protein